MRVLKDNAKKQLRVQGDISTANCQRTQGLVHPSMHKHFNKRKGSDLQTKFATKRCASLVTSTNDNLLEELNLALVGKKIPILPGLGLTLWELRTKH